jgi:hypothetical protein
MMKKVGPSEPWLNPGITIRASPIHGKGFFAERNIQEGETIVIWGGCYTDKKGAESARKKGLGTMQWDDDIFSHESDIYPEAFSINHSCDPNTWMKDAFTLITSRLIEVGEELTIDYVLFITEDNSPDWTCNCGSDNCRGTLKITDWKNAELQKKYQGHFSPLLNKMIGELYKDQLRL